MCYRESFNVSTFLRFGLLLFLLVVLRSPVGSGLASLLSLEGSLLSGASRGLLELGVGAQSGEVVAGAEVDVVVLDVALGEGFEADGAAALDLGFEGADGAEDDLVALEDELTHADAEVAAPRRKSLQRKP